MSYPGGSTYPGTMTFPTSGQLWDPPAPVTLAYADSLSGWKLTDPTRITSFSVMRIDRDSVELGPLDGVVYGSGSFLSWTGSASIKGTGQLEVVDTTPWMDIIRDWESERLRITGHIEGYGDVPLGIWLPAAPVRNRTATGQSWAVELTDLGAIADGDVWFDPRSIFGGSVPAAFHAAAGHPVMDYIIDDLVWQLDPFNPGLPTSRRYLWQRLDRDPSALVPRDMTWEPGTTILRIINDLLDACGFFSMWVDGDGFYRCDRYVRPQNRPAEFSATGAFTAGPRSIFTPDYPLGQDLHAVPNRVVAVSQGEEATPALVAASELPFSHPLSFQRRGRWVTLVETEVEADGPVALQAWCDRRLSTLSGASLTSTIEHLWMPGLKPNDVIQWEAPGFHGRATVTKTTVPLDPLGLCQTEIREVTGV